MANVIGQRLRRLEDRRFLMGEGSFVDNLRLPDALHVTFVRSEVAHVRILDIDAAAARALPNTQVFTAADIDLGSFGVRHVDMPATGERIWRALQNAASRDAQGDGGS